MQNPGQVKVALVCVRLTVNIKIIRWVIFDKESDSEKRGWTRWENQRHNLYHSLDSRSCRPHQSCLHKDIKQNRFHNVAHNLEHFYKSLWEMCWPPRTLDHPKAPSLVQNYHHGNLKQKSTTKNIYTQVYRQKNCPCEIVHNHSSTASAVPQSGTFPLLLPNLDWNIIEKESHKNFPICNPPEKIDDDLQHLCPDNLLNQSYPVSCMRQLWERAQHL